MSKRMKLPNGFGQITKITNKRLRNPYRAMVTVGKTEEGRCIQRILKPQGYFRTYNEAYAALLEYNKKPYDLDNQITMGELYERWSELHFQKISEARKVSIRSAWKKVSKYENIIVKEFTPRHVKMCIDMSDSFAVRNDIKSMLNQMFDYAIGYEYIDRNVARNLRGEVVRPESTKPHKAFTSDEIAILSSDNSEIANIILMQCYMGWRPQEILKLKVSDIDIEHKMIKGGMKTESGKDRLVPIHPNIINEVKKIKSVAEMRKYNYWLGDDMSYMKYYRQFTALMKKYNMDHTPHDPRKTFITAAKKYNVNEYAIKRIVGHKIDDITERVYTERTEEWLIEEIEKIECL